MNEIFNDTNQIFISSIVGFIGVLIGTIITSIVTFKTKSKETRLRVLEKIFDKRIEAHENILHLVKRIRTVVSTGKKDEEDNLISFPLALNSKDEWLTFHRDAFTMIQYNIHWLDTKLERELGFVQDYFTTLNQTIVNATDDIYPKVGLIIKQDFIDIAYIVEDIAFDYFRKDIYKMKINRHNKWHKYSKKETMRRINETLLLKKADEIRILNI